MSNGVVTTTIVTNVSTVAGVTFVPPPVFGTLGFQAPSGPAILAGVQADWAAAFNAALNFNLNTPQGQLVSSEAAVIANVYALFTYFASQCDPAYAQGRNQDAIGRIYFLTRNPAEPTTLQVNWIGAAGESSRRGRLSRTYRGTSILLSRWRPSPSAVPLPYNSTAPPTALSRCQAQTTSRYTRPFWPDLGQCSVRH